MFGLLPGLAFKAMQNKRFYLFVLLTVVLFLLGLCLVPAGSSTHHLTRVQVELRGVENEPSSRNIIIEELKNQLLSERLAETLADISKEHVLASEVLSQSNMEGVRDRLINGALSFESCSKNDSSQGFFITLRGSGTADEKAFLSHLAGSIQQSLTPKTNQQQVLQQLARLRQQLKRASVLQEESRESVQQALARRVEADLERQTAQDRPETLVGKDVESGWEMQKLVAERKNTLQEYRSNLSRDFPEKGETQNSLIRQIDYLDREIKRLQSGEGGSDRLAGRQEGVEKASFVEVEPAAFASGKPAAEYKSELALIVNRLDLVQSSHRESEEVTDQLEQLLVQQYPTVVVSGLVQQQNQDLDLTHLLVALIVSGLVSAVFVMRIHAKSFAEFITDTQSAENALQLPVIGKVNLPAGPRSSSRRSRWIQPVTRGCELLLVAAFVVFFFLLLVNSDFSIEWLANPVQLVRDSF